MEIKQFKNRNAIVLGATDPDFDTVSSKFKAAYHQSLLPEGRHIFASDVSDVFCVNHGTHITTHRMRSNWNGWHDLAAYSLPDFEDKGTVNYADPSNGVHRNIVTYDATNNAP